MDYNGNVSKFFFPPAWFFKLAYTFNLRVQILNRKSFELITNIENVEYFYFLKYKN